MTTPNDQQNQGGSQQPLSDQQPQTIDPSRVLTAAQHEEPAAEGEGQPPEVIEGQLSSDQGPDGDYRLLVPQDIPVGKVSDEWLGTLGEFAGAARDAGLPYSVAQAAVEAFVDSDAA